MPLIPILAITGIGISGFFAGRKTAPAPARPEPEMTSTGGGLLLAGLAVGAYFLFKKGGK